MISSIQLRNMASSMNVPSAKFGVNCARPLGGCTALPWSIAISNLRVGSLSLLPLGRQLTCSSDILLTRDLSAADTWSTGPLVKPTDFGLLRFVDLDNLWLTTRCGSESYTAPEIVMGSQYDGCHTTPGHVGSCCMHLRPGVYHSIPFTFTVGLTRRAGKECCCGSPNASTVGPR